MTPRETIMAQIDEEFANFFEFNTDDKSYVTSVSCKLFAERMMAKKPALKPIEMSDIRLITGEGKLSANTVLQAVNVILRQR